MAVWHTNIGVDILEYWVGKHVYGREACVWVGKHVYGVAGGAIGIGSQLRPNKLYSWAMYWWKWLLLLQLILEERCFSDINFYLMTRLDLS